jgi:PIN domain nuclease of toxin-antitoxin system
VNKYVVDSMALILRLEKRKMPDQLNTIFKQAEEGENILIIPAMVFAELAYLAEKKRINTSISDAKNYLDKYTNITETAMTISTVKYAFQIDDIPELHDRIIAASGKEFNVPILTNDPEIQNSRHVKSIWKN